MSVGRLVKGGSDDFCVDSAGHIGNFFRAFIDEQHHQIGLGMVGCNGICNVFHEDGLTCFGLSNDECTLSFADGREQINDACADVSGLRIAAKGELFLGEERC